jgi:hypothetical protein
MCINIAFKALIFVTLSFQLGRLLQWESRNNMDVHVYTILNLQLMGRELTDSVYSCQLFENDSDKSEFDSGGN